MQTARGVLTGLAGIGIIVCVALSGAAEDAQAGAGENKRPTVSWVKGAVRDTAGKPIPDADVYAYAVYYGGIRMYEMIRSAKTDKEGRYTITGEGGLECFSATLIAHAPGRCPTWSWLPQPSPRDIAAKTVPTVDFTITDQGGSLEVEVLRDGKPAAKIAVAAWLQGANLREIWAMGNGRESQTVENVVYPVVTTDAKGIARFENLIPGMYQIIAADCKVDRVRAMRHRLWGGDATFGGATGLAVSKGTLTRHRLTIFRQDTKAYAQVFRTDGKPLTGKFTPIDFHQPNEGGWSSSIELDEHGVGTRELDSSGLWCVSFKYLDTPVKSIPIQSPPYHEAVGVIAASGLLKPKSPAPFTAVNVEPAKVTVMLVDEAGKPLQGTVKIGGLVGDPTVSGTTGSDGVMQFNIPRTWHYQVRATISGLASMIQGEGDSPLPGDADLRIGRAVLPQWITPLPNTDTTVVLKAEPVGFVRGQLVPPPGKKTAEYAVYVQQRQYEHGAGSHYQYKTGAYAAGPFPSGKASLRIFERANNRQIGTQEVTVEAGKVSQVELHPPAPSPETAAPGQVLMGMGGIQGQGLGVEALRGTITMPDGKTPAWGAMVFFVNADDDQAGAAGIADPAGNIQAHPRWVSGGGDGDLPLPPGIKGPVVVAVLPGLCGATIVTPTPGKPLAITLPGPRRVKGRVTVGGAGVASKPGRIRVLAACEGKGKLSGLLSVQTVADADGNFVLTGLTPGAYKVQAVLENIWLSDAAGVRVDDGQAADLELAIGSPGGAVNVLVTGADGKPLAGGRLTIERPEGPLAKLCWPDEWVSDGAGRVYIPTLEAGRHVLHVKSDGSTHAFTVPPLPDDKTTEVMVQVKRP